MAEPSYLLASADIEGPYRYNLRRVWDATQPRLLWVMLNPSTADAEKLDPTLRRCLSFSRLWGYGGFEVANLYAFRATDPRELGLSADPRLHDPVGPRNDAAIQDALGRCASAVCAWGSNARRTREAQVMTLMRSAQTDVFALGFTDAGKPVHPLYQKASTVPFIWLRGGIPA